MRLRFCRFCSVLAAFILPHTITALGCGDATVTINSAADATTIASCTKIGGSVLVSAIDETIDLSGSSQTIGGDFIVQDLGNLISLSHDTLSSIGGAFKIRNLTLLSTLAFGILQKVDSIDWESMTNIDTLTFGNAVTSARNIAISNTFLSTLEGISVDSADIIDIKGNLRLTDFTMGLRNITDSLNIKSNGPDFALTMPNLVWASNMNVSDVASFSAPSLTTINSSMHFDSNSFETFWAPSLMNVQAGPLSFINNAVLTSVSMPLLESVAGDFTITNNTAFKVADGFPRLSTVEGSVMITGDFESVSFPALERVNGNFYVNGTTNLDCSQFQDLATNGIVDGIVSCAGIIYEAATTSNSSSASTNASSGLSTGARIGIGVGIGSMVLIAIVAVTLWLRRKRVRRTKINEEPARADPMDDPTEDPMHKKPELHGESAGRDFTRHEVDGQGLNRNSDMPAELYDQSGRNKQSGIHEIDGIKVNARSNKERGQGMYELE